MKCKKILIVALLISVVITIISIPQISRADFDVNTLKIEQDEQFQKDVNSISAILSPLGTLLKIIGSILSVVILMFIGIKYMTASVGEKATYKEKLILYMFGVLFVFGIISISNAVIDVGKQINNASSMENIGQIIITVTSVVGSFVSVIALGIMGIKYISKASLEEKAQYKKSIIPYVIGASIVFAASTIAGMLADVASGL